MAKTLIYITLVAATIIGVNGLLAFTKPVDVDATMAIDNSAWIEHFDRGSLDSRWVWVRENPTYWSLTANPGFLRLVTRGSLHEAGNSLENILLTPVSGIDYRIITKLTFSPTENFHRAGLLVYGDDDNYMQLTRVYTNGDRVRIKTEIGGVASYVSAPDVVTATTLYLRIDKYGNDYYGFFSLDGTVWEFVGQSNLSLPTTFVGLLAANGPTATEINADFEYFQFIPRTFNNVWLDDFSESTLDSAWTWRNEDPTHWSLTTNPGFLQIITQNGGMFAGAYHNLLATEATSDNFRITARAIISPTENYQSASIIVYGDNDNYVRVGRRFAYPDHEINFRQISDGSLAVNIGVAETATSVYLRIIREGDEYGGYYSADGSSYNYIGQTTEGIANPKIGLVSENGPSTMEIQSDYDFFLLENNVYWGYLPLVLK